jgi:hypothetical protein
LVREREWVLIKVSRQISIAQNISISTVYRIGSLLPATPQKFQSRRKKINNTPTQKYLVSITTQDTYHCHLAYKEVAKITRVQASEKILCTAFPAEGYSYCSASNTPYLHLTTKLK